MWALYHPLLCQHSLFHSLCFAASLLFHFQLSFSFLNAGQSPRFCSASLPHSSISALSPPSLQLSLLLLSPCPPICWSHPDNSAEGRPPTPRAVLLSWCFPLLPLPVRLFFSHTLMPLLPWFMSFYLTPLLSSISFFLLTMLSIHHLSSQLFFPCSYQPVHPLQHWDQNVR